MKLFTASPSAFVSIPCILLCGVLSCFSMELVAALWASSLSFCCQLHEAPVHHVCDHIARQVFAPFRAMCPEQSSRHVVRHEHVQVYVCKFFLSKVQHLQAMTVSWTN
jgi:hypothetical protein